MPRRALLSPINWDRVIDVGTGTVRELRLEPKEATPKAFEARWCTWQRAKPIVYRATEAGANPDYFRAATLLLAELAIVAVWQHQPWHDRLPEALRRFNEQEKKKPHECDFITPRGEFALLHQNRILRRYGRAGRGHPSDPRAIAVFSQLAQSLTMLRPRVASPYALLAELAQAIYPPLFGLGSPKQLQYRVLKYRVRALPGQVSLSAVVRRLPRG